MSLIRISRCTDNSPTYKWIKHYIYLNTCKLGSGNFSDVYLGIDSITSKNVAIKIIKIHPFTNQIIQQLLQNQITILQDIQHHNLIQCYDAFLSQNNCYIITQYCTGGDLEKLLQTKHCFNQRQLYPIIYGIYQGLVYLNQVGIIHRDLKPANILINSNGEPKIADFGFAVRSRTVFKDINIGSPVYMSPEGIINHEYGPKSQVWSFGVLIYELLHGFAPLSHCKDEQSLRETVLVPPRFRQGISYDLRKMIQCCLTVDLKNRLQIKQIMYTPFMVRLISQFQRQASQRQLPITNWTGETKLTNSPIFMPDILSYQEGLSLLHYCRLIHKTSEVFPSQILSQWLLSVSENLISIRLMDGGNGCHRNLMLTIRDYYTKYKILHRESKIAVSIYDVVLECERLNREYRNWRPILNQMQKIQLSYIIMLGEQTNLLWKFIKNHYIQGYTSMSQIPKYLENIRILQKQLRSIM